jgi:hypothetical protein
MDENPTIGRRETAGGKEFRQHRRLKFLVSFVVSLMRD